MSQLLPQSRSLYRQFLRELPARRPSILASPSPVHVQIRADLFEQQQQTQQQAQLSHDLAEQLIKYLRAQRTYTTLVERYNPGMNMTEEERVRLTARRVGMDLPVEHDEGSK